MIRHLRTCGFAGLGLLTLLILAGSPAPVQAADVLTFKNNTKANLYLRGAVVVNNQIRWDKPIPMKPGDVVRLALPGNKIIHILDANPPNPILFQGTLPPATKDLYFLIQPDPLLPKVNLEPVEPPMMPR